jgi:hypothetical protein
VKPTLLLFVAVLPLLVMGCADCCDESLPEPEGIAAEDSALEFEEASAYETVERPPGPGRRGTDVSPSRPANPPPPNRTRAARTNSRGGPVGTLSGRAKAIVYKPKPYLLGLIWLKNHQLPQGYWSARDFALACKKRPSCSGRGWGSDLEVTGLALLAFARCGHTHKHGKFKRTVKMALKYLCLEVQLEDGSFRGSGDTSLDYRSQAILTLALVEAYLRARRTELLREYCQRAVSFLLSLRRPGAGWAEGRGWAPDIVTSAWALLALRRAAQAGLAQAQNRQAMGEVKAWLGILRSTQGSPLLRTAHLLARTLVRGREGAVPGAVPAQGATCIAGDLWILRGSAALPDLEFLYFASGLLAVHKPLEPVFRSVCLEGVTPLQQADGCSRGSWNPGWGRSAEGGRVWSTAMAVLCLAPVYEE